MLEKSGADRFPDHGGSAGDVQHLHGLGLDHRRLGSILAALHLIGGQRSVFARTVQSVRLSVQIAGAEHAVLALYDDGSGGVTRMICSTEDAADLKRIREFVANQEALRDHPGKEPDPARTALRIPVSISSGPAGALYLLGGPADAGEDEGLREFLRLAAQLVEDSARYEESSRQMAWRPALADVNQLLLSSVADDETVVWQRIADHVHKLTQARTVTLSTPSDDDPDLLQVRVVAGLGHSTLAGLSSPRPGSLVDLAMSTRTSQSGPAADHLGVSHTQVEPQTALGPLLAIPLAGQGVPRGAIVLSREANRRSYSSRDILLVEEFATQATLALELAESRAAQISLRARTEIEQVAQTFQDQLIQRLYALSLTLDLAAQTSSETWLPQARADIEAAISAARRSLDHNYGR